MAQQTAVEWLKDKLKETYDKEGKLPLAYTLHLVEQAKQMEKEQIMRASKDGISHGYTEGVVFGINPRDYIVKWSEQYYNETYGK